MKVAVTGHTSGIGKGLYENFLNKGYFVRGFSRSNGFDISILKDRLAIIEETKHFDIFINNAYNKNDDSQLQMLRDIFKSWQNQNKKIINISSRGSSQNHEYAISKRFQDIFCESKLLEYPTIINIRPGYVDTPMIKHILNKKMSVDRVVTIVEFSLEHNIDSITFGTK